MIIKIRHTAVKVRQVQSGTLKGEDKFTGAITHSVVGTVDGKFIKLALGTENEKVAIRRIEKIKTGCAVGPDSQVWPELGDALPRRTFEFFAGKVGYARKQSAALAKPTWADLISVFELEMSRLITNKKRGATREEGVMSDSTRDRYRHTFRHFTDFLAHESTPLDGIGPSTVEMFKVSRMKAIEQLKQGRGGSSIALDVAVLHRVFAFAVDKKLMSSNPINLGKESKPGKNPKNGARSFTAAELGALREHAGQDLFTFLVLRWTGLRVSDAMNLRWQNVQFERGVNGEVEVLTQKRTKTAIIPLSTELRDALEETLSARYKGKPEVAAEDFVLYNPDTKAPFTNRKRLNARMNALGVRAKVARVTPHCFRDTFACDMLARGASIYDVAKMLADTVDTVEKHYAAFVPAARDAAQKKMDNGIGIEEQARLTKERGRKVVAIRKKA